MGEKKETLWTVPFVLDTVINLLVFLIYYLLMVIIAVVAKDELHASASEAGLAVGIYIIGTVVARIFAGRFVGTLGCRRVLYGGLFIYLISTILYFYIEFARLGYYPLCKRFCLRCYIDGNQYDCGYGYSEDSSR